MPIPNTAWGNTRRPNSPPVGSLESPGESLSRNFDVRLTVTESQSDNFDVWLATSTQHSFLNDIILRAVVIASEDSDVQLTIPDFFSENADIKIRIFNPISLSENADIYMQTWPAEGISFSDENDVFLRAVESLSNGLDIRMEVVEVISEGADTEITVEEPRSDLLDVRLSVHTDINDEDVVKIANMYERRFLPLFSENVMFRRGTDTLRYLLFWAFATAEANARWNLEDMIESLRLLLAERAALDYVGDRVGETRWQLYSDRVDRYETDEAFRARLIPYFRERRGTLGSLQAAVQALHDSYGGSSAFYSYRVGDGWLLGDWGSVAYNQGGSESWRGTGGRSDLARSTFLGGPLENFNPLEYMQRTDLWVLGTGLLSLTGTMAFTAGSIIVTGEGTNFGAEVRVGDYLYAYEGLGPSTTYIGTVARIVSANKIELTNASGWGTGATFYEIRSKYPDFNYNPDSPSHSDLGLTTYLGDRERLGPFTFLVVVTNYPMETEWQQLYLHTIDRYKMAGTVPIIIFREASMLQQQVIPATGVDTYTVTGVHLEGLTAIVFIDGVGQEPGAYTLTNNGDDTDIQFSEVVDPGMNIWVNWIEESA